VSSGTKSVDVSRVRIPGTHLQGWRAIAVGALAIYVVLFIVLNNRKLEINFVFFKIRSHELLALIVIVLLGFIAGFIMGGRRQRAKPPPARAQAVEGAAASPGPVE
jgi:uncharacterized integral membrane protein